MELVPVASKPQLAVIVLTKELPRGVWELVTQMGAYACLVKPYTTGEGLDRAIQDAIEFVAMLPKPDQHRSRSGVGSPQGGLGQTTSDDLQHGSLQSQHTQEM